MVRVHFSPPASFQKLICPYCRACTLKTAQGRNESEATAAEETSQKRELRSDKSGDCGTVSIVLGTGAAVEARSSEQERRVDAMALIADEGRDKLRKAVGSRK